MSQLQLVHSVRGRSVGLFCPEHFSLFLSGGYGLKVLPICHVSNNFVAWGAAEAGSGAF